MLLCVSRRIKHHNVNCSFNLKMHLVLNFWNIHVSTTNLKIYLFSRLQNLKVVQFLFRTLNEAEGRFTSVERLREYSKVCRYYIVRFITVYEHGYLGSTGILLLFYHSKLFISMLPLHWYFLQLIATIYALIIDNISTIMNTMRIQCTIIQPCMNRNYNIYNSI